MGHAADEEGSIQYFQEKDEKMNITNANAVRRQPRV
jgi:hypothetical protein